MQLCWTCAVYASEWWEGMAWEVDKTGEQVVTMGCSRSCEACNCRVSNYSDKNSQINPDN